MSDDIPFPKHTRPLLQPPTNQQCQQQHERQSSRAPAPDPTPSINDDHDREDEIRLTHAPPHIHQLLMRYCLTLIACFVPALVVVVIVELQGYRLASSPSVDLAAYRPTQATSPLTNLALKNPAATTHFAAPDSLFPSNSQLDHGSLWRGVQHSNTFTSLCRRIKRRCRCKKC